MGLDTYNVYNILTRTHGITPYDEYWIRFDGEKISYDDALREFEEYMIEPEAQPVQAPAVPAPAPRQERSAAPAKAEEKPDISSILNQNKVDVESITAGSRIPVCIAPDESYAPAMELENNKMSEDEIEKLLHSVGLDDDESDSEKEGSDSSDSSKDSSDKPDIAVGNAEALPVDGSSRSEEYTEPSGGKMSQEDIEKLLAASAPAEPEPAPEPVKTAPAKPARKSRDTKKALLDRLAPSGGSGSSDGKMSHDDIEKAFMERLAPSAPAEPGKSEPSGGKMSQEDIEKLLAANAPAEPEPAKPEPEKVPETAPAGGKMSQNDIEALLNSMKEEANR